jgi:hypothetical protein
VQGKKVGTGQQVISLSARPPSGVSVLGEIRVENDDAHFQAERSSPPPGGRFSGANDPQGLAGDLHPRKRFFSQCPVLVEWLASGICRASAISMATVSGSGGRAAEGCIHDHHALRLAALGPCFDADAGPADDLELAGRLENVFRHMGAAAYHQSVGIGNGLQQFVRGNARMVCQFDSLGLLKDPEASEENSSETSTFITQSRFCMDFFGTQFATLLSKTVR